MLDEAKELIKSATDDLSLEWCIKREDWLSRYEQRREMVVRAYDDGSDFEPWVWVIPRMFEAATFFQTKELALADARRVAEELGLKMKVEGE